VNTYGLYQPSKLLAAMIGVSLLLHVLLWLLLQGLDLSGDAPVRLADSVELILIDDLPEVLLPEDDADQSPPRQVVLIPESHADQPPEQADYLAEFNSRAADLIPGGEAGARPGARRQSEAPMVAIDRARPAEPPPSPVGSETLDQGEVPTAELAEPSERNEAETEDGPNDDITPDDYQEWLAEQRAPSLLGQGDRGFDFDQLEGGDIHTNVDIVGGYRLNTYEWNFVPWIRRFANDLQRSWIPPYAYRLGIIHGQTEVRVVVERDGTPTSIVPLSNEGHPSFEDASVNALKACAPYLPLPPDFPRDQLVIVFTLIYPERPQR